MNKIAFVAAALALGAGGCEQATIGASATLDTDHPQTLVGRLDSHTTAFVVDLDRDGLSDVAVFDFDSQGVRHPNPPTDPSYSFFGERPRFYLYYGREGGLGRERSTGSADVAFVVGDGEMVEALGAADVDGDGLDELLVYTLGVARDNVIDGVVFPDSVGDAIYVVDGGVRYADEVDLPETAHRVPTPRRNREHYERRADLADLDGTPGLEVAYAEAQGLEPPVHRGVPIRDLHDGTLVATLTLREREYLWVLAVMDLDADGFADVIGESIMEDEEGGVAERGIAVFYGPIDADRAVGDAGTEFFAVRDFVPNRMVVGNYTGDAALDALMLQSDRLFVLRGGPRAGFPDLADRWEPLAATDALLENGPFTNRWVAFAGDRDSDGYDEIVGRNGDQLHLFAPSGQVHDTLSLPAANDSLEVWFGGTGDTDGDRRMDLVLGASSNSGGRSSGYIISGFGG